MTFFTRTPLLLVALIAARAETLPLKNSSFESPALPRDGQQATNAIDGWTLNGVGGVFVNNGAYGNKMDDAEGAQLSFLNGTKSGSLQQEVAEHLTALTTYSATASIGLRKDTPLGKGASLFLKLQAGERTLAVKEVLVGREPLSDSKLGEFSVTYTTGVVAPKGPLRLTIATAELGKDKGDWTLDNVRVEANPAVPDLAAKLQFAANPHKSVTATSKAIRYNRDIRPILSENCFACHGPDSASRKAGLRLDRFADATAPRKDSPPAIVSHDPEKSALMSRVLTKDEDDVMPPRKTKKSLTPKQIELLRQWIADGAEYELHWSYLPPEKAPLPEVKNGKWPRNEIDRFILAPLEKEKLTPAPEADARTLARRVSLDLTGLPPAPEMVDAFLKDKSKDAYEHYVDRLLDSKAWGEHRARYWLDAARFADTHGIHIDNYREMWTFREWVIKAFNQNLPFDRFTIEQLAGDLLPNPTLDQLIASGFNRCNITSNEGGLIDEEYYVLYMKDRTETASTIWLGTSAMCAGCHDHKFDPISMREYYSLAAFFNNSTTGSRDGNRKDPAPVKVVPTDEDRSRWFALETEIPAAKDRVEARRKAARPEFEKWLTDAKPEPFANAVGIGNPLLLAPLDGSTELATNATFVDGHISAKAFKSAPDVQLKLGNIGDFERDASWSYGAWVRIEDKDQQGGLIARMDEKRDYRGWDLFLDKDRPVAHFVNKWPDNAVRVASSTRLEPNKWNHIFVTYDGSSKPQGVRIFINGKPAALENDDKKLTDTIRNDVPLTVAHRSGGGSLKNVEIQDVRVYNLLLTPEEVGSIGRNTRAAWLAGKANRTKDENEELYLPWLSLLDAPFVKEAATLASLEKEDRDIRQRGSIAHIFTERSEEAAAYILNRGEYDRRRERVMAGTPEVLPPMADELPRNRLGLAKWLTQPNHPLTARVTVNRFWQEVFGTGLVRTTGDFGVSGELPSNPELLDWLAVDFIESGWDVKRFFKRLVTSATYRQTAVATPEKIQADPQNRLLSRGPRFRMDAEMVRDYALASSGLLVQKIGGPSVKPYQPEGVWETVAMRESDTRNYIQDHGDKLYRRSLYTFWKRSAPPASMDIFNAPSRETCTVRRERTDTPLQALATLNDIQFIEAARALAERTLQSKAPNTKARLNFIAERLLARDLRPEELRVTESILEDLLATYRKSPADAEALIAVGESKPDPKLPKVDLAAYTMAVNQLMNLDEVLNK